MIGIYTFTGILALAYLKTGCGSITVLYALGICLVKMRHAMPSGADEKQFKHRLF